MRVIKEWLPRLSDFLPVVLRYVFDVFYFYFYLFIFFTLQTIGFIEAKMNCLGPLVVVGLYI